MPPPADNGLANFDEALTRVCEEVVKPNAADVDQAARHPVESWRALWEIGALRLCVPKEHGGFGAAMPAYISTILKLARYCAATAMTVHMHSSACAIIAERGDQAQQAAAYPHVLDRLGLFGAWTSEPTSSANVKPHHETIATRDGSEFVITGQKYFCTMAGFAEVALVGCGVDDPSIPPADTIHNNMRLFIVPTASAGVTVSGTWNPIGMRGTVSPGVSFDAVRVPYEAMLSPGSAPASSEQGWLGFAAVIVGSAQMAVDSTLDYLGKRKLVTDGEVRARDPAVQSQVGEAAYPLIVARLALMDAANRWNDASARRLNAALAKLAATDAALNVTRDCMTAVGGVSATKALPIERSYRDVRTATLMPPSRLRLTQIVGAERLGV